MPSGSGGMAVAPAHKWSLQERQLRESLEEYSEQLTEAAAALLVPPPGPAS